MAQENLVIGKQSVDNYPYGRLKCTMFFWVEFNPKKGYRAVTQSINPKNNRLNKPHAGTYSDLVFMSRNEDNHIKFNSFSFNQNNAVNKLKALLTNRPELTFTAEEHQYLWGQILGRLRVDTFYATAYGKKYKEGADKEQYQKLLGLPSIANAFANREDIRTILTIDHDFEGANALIEATEEKGYTVTTYA